MKFRIQLPFVFLMLISIMIYSGCSGPGKEVMIDELQVENIGLYDHQDNFHNLYYYDDAKGIVLYVHGNGCPIVRNGFRTYEEIAKKYEEEGFKFFMVNSNLQDERAAIAAEANEFGMTLPILIDDLQLLAENIRIHRTAETILIDPSNWKIVYRGPIDDQLGYEGKKEEARETYLINALDAFVAGNEIVEAYRNTKGCAVTIKSSYTDNKDLTYTEHIAPILKENCTQCHRPNGIAPWAMTSYNAVFGWSKMIKEVLKTQRMPPWQADPHYGTFVNDISITEEEKSKIISWIDNGLQKGEGDDPLSDVKESSDQWELGKPDEVVLLSEEIIPATGIIDYRYQEFEMDIPEDKKIKAIEVIPGNKEVLHHILATIQYPEDYEMPVSRERGPWLDGVFATWAPGAEPEVFPEGTYRTIPKGSTLHVQLHYTTNGKEQADISKLGLYYADDEAGKEFVSLGPADFKIKIKPHLKEQKFVAEEHFDKDLTLYGMFPHMHFRGKSMKYTLIYPDQSEEVLLNVPNYSFNWQRYYYLMNPKYIEAGSTLRVEAVYDNSAQNAFNPDPSKTIYFGEQTFDEMMIGYISFVYGKHISDYTMN